MVQLPEICFAACRNPAVAVGLPIALGVASGFAASAIRSERTGQTIAQCPHPAYTWLWVASYGLMGYASHLAVQSFDAAPTPSGTDAAHAALAVYWAQLALHLVWAPLFIGGNMPKLALVDSSVLTASALTLTYQMSQLNWTSVSPTWFLAPVCAWLGYQTYLNATTVYHEEKSKP